MYLPLSLRTFVLHPYYKIVYYVNEFEDCIYVITLWDTRRDPEEYVNELFDEKNRLTFKCGIGIVSYGDCSDRKYYFSFQHIRVARGRGGLVLVGGCGRC